MKFMKQATRFGFGASLAALSAGAMAAIPAEVTTALGDLKTDVITIGSLMFIIVLALVAFAYFKKAAH